MRVSDQCWLEQQGEDPERWVRDTVRREIDLRRQLGYTETRPDWRRLQLGQLTITSDGGPQHALPTVRQELRQAGQRVLIMIDWLGKHSSDDRGSSYATLVSGGLLCLGACRRPEFLQLLLEGVAL